MKLKDINAEITFELWMTPALYEETPTTGWALLLLTKMTRHTD
jgi:hypothetical protein